MIVSPKSSNMSPSSAREAVHEPPQNTFVSDDSVQMLQTLRYDKNQQFLFGFAQQDTLNNKNFGQIVCKSVVVPDNIEKNFVTSKVRESPKFKAKQDCMINRALPFKMSQFNHFERSSVQQISDLPKETGNSRLVHNDRSGFSPNLTLNQPSELTLVKTINNQKNVSASIDHAYLGMTRNSNNNYNHNSLRPNDSKNTNILSSLDPSYQKLRLSSSKGFQIVQKMGINMQSQNKKDLDE